ncbi:DEAD/DEAH box helicase [Yinghuangia sp. ASG 101]|uniref:UvrD-helicase domain-containing protein n=1 Tax=Yinghuangia sp. ASG 101 TaxID=2896848 RepID=UPI001E4A6879|nr:DEAD/DEAH box helicase [Yinghuangia sp. ASG 101]UGQ11291.1 DEAD/DEAH box helicase [Yinghuangia sp. ASG 101]
MPQLAFANTFWEEFDQLGKKVRAGVRKAMRKFQQLPVAELYADKGLHLESVEQARDPRMRTIRIDDFWRGVVLAPDDGTDVFLLVNVLPHDAAYTWAAKRLYTVNTATRGLEVRNVVAIEQITPVFEQEARTAPTLLFEKCSDTVLKSLGIDAATLRAARALTDKTQLEALGGLMPEDQFEVLQFLAEGFTPDEIYREVVTARRPAVTDAAQETLAAAIANTRNRITLVSGPAELEDVLTKPFAAWRVFLHPTQHRVAYRPTYTGPAQITGGPGTGKTVVALHRVKHLLERSPDTRILLTTYTTSLAASLHESLKFLLGVDELPDRVEVTTVNALAFKAVRQLKGTPADLIGDADERVRWERLRRKLDLPWTEAFLSQEYRHIVLAQDLDDEKAYLSCVRRGRGSRLDSAHRPAVWAAIQGFQDGLAAERKQTHLQLCAHAARLLGEHPGQGPRYDHVVVDEAQDLHPAQWRVLRAVVALGPDDLFITGDPHQRIYDARVSLRSLGIPVAGRTGRLRINYRSTEEILRRARGILDGAQVSDLGGDGTDSLAGYRSLLRGDAPVVAAFGSEPEEATAIVAQIQTWLELGVRPAEIAVCARFKSLTDKVAQRLTAVGIAAVPLKDTSAADAVRIASMHSLKGLEFRCVAVGGVTASAFPFRTAVTPEDVDRLQHAADMAAERCLLYVACTRAREFLHISYTGKPSRFLSG